MQAAILAAALLGLATVGCGGGPVREFPFGLATPGQCSTILEHAHILRFFLGQQKPLAKAGRF
jgi:hypothetical protein